MFAEKDDGLAMKPPMGWRSWNAFYANINEGLMRKQIEALTVPRGDNGRPAAVGTSLAQLGYRSFGIDEGYEGCGLGVNGTVHLADGTPTVDQKRFPNLPQLVKYGHAKGLSMGFYLNGCGCNEKEERAINYAGDVRAAVGMGFDEVKIDSCGAQKNLTLYDALLRASGRRLIVENCHQGKDWGQLDSGNPEQMGEGWCPYHLFRTSGDIVNLWDRVMSNLLSVLPFLADRPGGRGPTSRPGCWAYPDMLEVGRMPEHNAAESRSHFSAWAVVSAPLVLGFDLHNEEQMAVAWPFISRREVIAINQAWVRGAPSPSGRLLKQWKTRNLPTLLIRSEGLRDYRSPIQCAAWVREGFCFNEGRTLGPEFMHKFCAKSCGLCPAGEKFRGWAYEHGRLSRNGECIDLDGQLAGGHSGFNVMRTRPCLPHRAGSQQWNFANLTQGGRIVNNGQAAEMAVCLRVFKGWVWGEEAIVYAGPCDDGPSPPTRLRKKTASKEPSYTWTLRDGTLRNAQFGCVAVESQWGPPSTIWAKPLPGASVALLAINGADLPQTATLDFAELGLGGYARAGSAHSDAWLVRDVWASSELGLKSSLVVTLPPHDCVLLVLRKEGRAMTHSHDAAHSRSRIGLSESHSLTVRAGESATLS